MSTESRHESRHVAAGSVEIAHEPAEGVVSGTPSVGVLELGEFRGVEVGVWEITPGVVTDTEVDEVFVVLSGAGSVRFADGEVVGLGPGSLVRLAAGERTEWTITETLRKVYLA